MQFKAKMRFEYVEVFLNHWSTSNIFQLWVLFLQYFGLMVSYRLVLNKDVINSDIDNDELIPVWLIVNLRVEFLWIYGCDFCRKTVK